MKTSLWLLILIFVGTSAALAECYVENGTYYAKDRISLTTYAVAIDSKDKSKAGQLVDNGTIRFCSKTSAFVLEKFVNGLAKVSIQGVGIVWIYEKFLHCD